MYKEPKLLLLPRPDIGSQLLSWKGIQEDNSKRGITTKLPFYLAQSSVPY